MKGFKYQVFIAKEIIQNTILKFIWNQNDIHTFLLLRNK